MKRGARTPLEANLLLKSAIGTIGGFALACAISLVFLQWMPGAPDTPGRADIAMWLVPPLWLAITSASFLFHRCTHAIACLALASGATYLAAFLHMPAVSH
jgi:hypothetical protein